MIATAPTQPLSDTIDQDARPLSRRALDKIFGFDFFISYAWSDGAAYAKALAGLLQADGFEVFLDRIEYASGDDWKKVGAWTLRRTGQLLLVGSPAAIRSDPVVREVEIFSKTARRIVPIEFAGSLDWTQTDSRLSLYLPSEILRIKEPIAALASGPSEETVAIIRRTFDLVRQDKKRLRAIAMTALLLGALALAATAFGYYALLQRENARVSERKAISNEEQAKKNEALAVDNEQRAIKNEQTAKQNLSAMQKAQSRFIASAAREMVKEDPQRALGLLLEVVPRDVAHPDRPIVPEAMTALYKAAKANRLRGVLDEHSDRVNEARYNRDGSRIVTASKDKTAKIWDARTGVLTATLRGHTDNVRTAVFSPDDKQVLTASWDKTARIWDVASGLEVKQLSGHDSFLNAAAFNSDGTKIVTASNDRTARIWDAKSGSLISVLRGYLDEVDVVSFSPDGKLVVGAGSSLDSKDKTARVWDAKTGETKSILRGHSDGLICAEFSASGLLVVTGSRDGTARVWDVASGKSIAVLKGHTDSVVAVHFNRNGDRVITASEDKTARIWDAKKGNEIVSLRGHTGLLNDVEFSPDEHSVVTSSADNTIRIWDVKTGSSVAVLKGHTKEVRKTTYSPDGTYVISASEDSNAKIWDATTKWDGPNFSAATEITSLSFSHDGTRLISTSKDSTPFLWDTKSGGKVLTLVGHRDFVYRAAFSADDSSIVTASADDTARIWNSRTGVARCEMSGHKALVLDASFSSDQTKVVTASADSTAKLWNAETCELIKVLDHDQNDYVRNALFNKNGSRVLTLTLEKALRLWDSESGKVVALWNDRSDRVNSAKFSGDGTRVVTASERGSVGIWDAETGALIRSVGNSIGWIHEAAFSSDGRFIVLAQGDHTANIIDARTGEAIVSLTGHESSLRSAAFTSVDSRVVTSSAGDVRVWDATTGAEVDQIKQAQTDVSMIAISSDGARVAVALEDHTIRIADVPTGRSEVWLPATRAQLFSALSSDDKLQFGLAPLDRKRPIGDKVKLCEYLAGSAFDPERSSDDVIEITDFDLAIKACESAKETSANEPRVYFSLGQALEGKKQYPEAEQAYLIAAKANYGMAFYGLATLYDRKRRGIAQDPAKAADLYERAFDKGIMAAGDPLGRMFWDGNGITRDRQKAREIWERSASGGAPLSHQELGWLFEYSRDGKVPNLESALYHFLIAARLLESKGRDSEHARFRAATIAHGLPKETVARIWQAAQDWPKPK